MSKDFEKLLRWGCSVLIFVGLSHLHDKQPFTRSEVWIILTNFLAGVSLGIQLGYLVRMIVREYRESKKYEN